ncbi:MAG: isoprenyl transferase [Acidobacteria bacterium]|nr:isoprenyl transferase [Acidobacteriota bacterium]
MFDFEGVLERGSRDEFLLHQINPEKMPQHIAIIMDGNGRWAARRGRPRVVGHRAGVQAVRQSVETAARLKLKALTLYAFSVENWKRPHLEVVTLMSLLKEFLRSELAEIKRNNIRFTTSGRIEELDRSIQKEIAFAKQQTESNTGMVLNIALNYGGRNEIVDAFRQLCSDYQRTGRNPAEISENEISRYLYTAELPDPDLLIRTSGEMRISNFLLWQIAYSEIYVVDTLWPDFNRISLFEAIIEFQKRERRYGGLAPVEQSAARMAK